jgi:hypothetical protein
MQTVQQGEGSITIPRLVYDRSKLPQLPSGMTYDFERDAAAGYGGVAGRAPGAANASGYVRTSNAGTTFDKDFGWLAPTSNWRDVTDRENNAAQNASGGLFSAIGNALVPSDKPWMALLTAIMAGAAPAVSSALGGGAAGSLGSTALKAGVSAATGGNPFSNPLSMLANLAPGVAGEFGVPSDVIRGISTGITGAQFGLAANDYFNQRQYQANPTASTPATTTPLAPSPVINSKPIPDVYNAAAFGGSGGSSAQVVSDGGARVATSFAPDAYSNSDNTSQVIS